MARKLPIHIKYTQRREEEEKKKNENPLFEVY